MEVVDQPRAHIIDIGSFTNEGWPFMWVFCAHYPMIETDDNGAPTRIFGWKPDELRDLWLYVRRN